MTSSNKRNNVLFPSNEKEHFMKEWAIILDYLASRWFSFIVENEYAKAGIKINFKDHKFPKTIMKSKSNKVSYEILSKKIGQ